MCAICRRKTAITLAMAHNETRNRETYDERFTVEMIAERSIEFGIAFDCCNCIRSRYLMVSFQGIPYSSQTSKLRKGRKNVERRVFNDCPPSSHGCHWGSALGSPQHGHPQRECAFSFPSHAMCHLRLTSFGKLQSPCVSSPSPTLPRLQSL